MNVQTVGSARFLVSHVIQDDEGRLLAVAASRTVADRIAALLTEHGLGDLDHRQDHGRIDTEPLQTHTHRHLQAVTHDGTRWST